MRRILLPLFLLLSLCLLAEETFPIMAWGWLGGARSRQDDVSFYEEMKECGFSIAGFASTDGQIQAAGAAGLKVFYTDGNAMSNRDWRNPDVEQWRKDILPVVEKYRDNPTVMGYYVKDEPETADLPGLFQMATLLKELAPGKLAYVNLFSNSTQPYHYEPLTYEEYTERVFASDFPFSGFDQYNFYASGYIRTTMHSCMEIHRQAALRHNKPWWYCVLGIQHRYYATPNLVNMAYQAFSGLAYGARGISWFTYLPSDRPGWHNAPLDPFMNRTQVWYDMRLVNRTIQNYAHVLNHLRSDRVYHFGSTKPETDERVPGPDSESLIQTMGGTGNWLVGEFTHEEDGSRWLIIVNKNLQEPVECKPVWRKQPSRVRVHSQGGKWEIDFNRKPADSNIIQPGWGVLLHVYFD